MSHKKSVTLHNITANTVGYTSSQNRALGNEIREHKPKKALDEHNTAKTLKSLSFTSTCNKVCIIISQMPLSEKPGEDWIMGKIGEAGGNH